MRNACETFVEKPEGRSLFRIPRSRWEENNKMDLKEVVSKGVEWLAYERDQWTW
jgi:hypothetical protein